MWRILSPSWFACLELILALTPSANAALPVPPRQHAAWQTVKVAGVPDYVSDLVAMLFDAGLADPRGGEYREIELHLTWGQSDHLTTHGWYFPEGFAVCWDGLAHRVEHVGGPADLRADVASAQGNSWHGSRISAPPDAELVGAALLLRLDELDLAGQMLQNVRALPVARTGVTAPEAEHLDKLQWLEIAGTSWLSAGFTEALIAHGAGDDQLTVDISESLLLARPDYESAYRNLGPVRLPRDGSPVSFLDPVARLLADARRRLRETPRPPFDPTALVGMAQPARISVLIDRLEDFDERQVGAPGGIWYDRSPIYKILAQEGVQAIDPLLDALDHDQRLTRAYSYNRPYLPTWRPLPVSTVVEMLLKSYYGLDNFRWTDPVKRMAWLVRNKNRSLAERCFDLLADDSNDEIQWWDAAQVLLRGTAAGVVGDELRGRRNPSVSELLARRAVQMRGAWPADLGVLLFRWDPAGAPREWAAATKGDRVVNLDRLLPLWTWPDDEVLRAFARKLFVEPDSPMSPVGMIMAGHDAGSLIHSPLLMNEVFRECVLLGLERTEEIGTAERQPSGAVLVETATGMIMGSSGPDPISHLPTGKRSVRVGDYVAWALSQIKGFPSFDIESSPEERNSAIRATAEFLRAHSEDLRAPAELGLRRLVLFLAQ